MAAAFQNFSENWFPFVSIQYRQVKRNFDSYSDPGPVNAIGVREDIMDYQLGIQFKLDFIKSKYYFNTDYFKNFYGQILIGSSQVTKTDVLFEEFPSNYKDELGFTYGVSIFNEF